MPIDTLGQGICARCGRSAPKGLVVCDACQIAADVFNEHIRPQKPAALTPAPPTGAAMTCEVCGRGPLPQHGGISVFRQNEKGVKGIWRCAVHVTAPVDPEVAEIVVALERNEPTNG